MAKSNLKINVNAVSKSKRKYQLFQKLYKELIDEAIEMAAATNKEIVIRVREP